MANMIDYLDWRGDIPFSASPFNEIDNILLAELAMLEYSELLPEDGGARDFRELAEEYLEKYGEDGNYAGLVIPYKEIAGLLKKMAESERFGHMKVAFYINHIVDESAVQFSALTFIQPGEFMVASFCGTDDTLAGWKEDFRMSISKNLPAQVDSKLYLQAIAAKYDEPIYVCGHSKGGNLAIYASSKVAKAVKNRIIHVYSNDGPGFSDEFLDSRDYLAVKDRITTILPKQSMVATIFNQGNEQVVVDCTLPGVLSHNPFCWKVMGPEFIRVEALDRTSQAFHEGLCEVLYVLTPKEKQAFVEELFDALTTGGARTLTDLKNMNPIERVKILETVVKHKEIGRVFLMIFGETAKNFLGLTDNMPLIAKNLMKG